MPRPTPPGPSGPAAVPAGAPLAVALFNDAGDRADVASLAASQAMRRLLRRAGAVVRHAWYRGDWHGLGGDAASAAPDELLRTFADVDAVVVHGERSLCGGRGRHLLAILRAAQAHGLPTFLVNAVIDRLPDEHGRAVLAALTDCTVPDDATARLLAAHGIAHRLVPDAIFAAEFLQTPVVDLRDHLVLLDLGLPALADPAVAALRAAWDGPVHDYAVFDRSRALDWRHTVANLRAAAMILCGSHHATCLAMAAGVPFVRLDAEDLPFVGGHGRPDDYPTSAAGESATLAERVAAAMAETHWFSSMGAACEYLLPLDTFARLVPGLAPYSTGERALGSIDDALDAVRRTTPIGGSVLHAGAGDGRLVEALGESGFRAWGADAAWRLAHPARQRYSIGTPWGLPFADHVFSAVVVSAGWLDHLELEDLDLALTELARVTRDTIVLEVSGRALRARRAVDGERRESWWEERLDLHGFRAPLGARPIATGAQTLIVMQASTAVCSGCGRAHVRQGLRTGDTPAASVVATVAARGSAIRR